MKKHQLSILAFIIAIYTFTTYTATAQAPQGIPYQAIARNNSGALLASQAIRVRFSIHDSIATGTIVYQETFNPTTTTQGLFNVNVGMGSSSIGTFSSINWGVNAKFMQVELDPAGGTSYVEMGTTQMMSVPYSLHSNFSNAINPTVSATGDTMYFGAGNYKIIPGVSAANRPLTIGMSYGGGIIAYILVSGDPGYSATVQHGLIAATADQSTGAQWGCSFTTTVATGIALGTGSSNTIAILAACTGTGIAAQLCHAYRGGGYTDWYLPSKDELNKLYINKSYIDGFATSYYYWSSSEYSSVNAWSETFSAGYQGSNDKNAVYYVRAVRAF